MPLTNLMEKRNHVAYPNWDLSIWFGYVEHKLFSCGALPSRFWTLFSLLFPLNFFSEVNVLGQVLIQFCGFSWKGILSEVPFLIGTLNFYNFFHLKPIFHDSSKFRTMHFWAL